MPSASSPTTSASGSGPRLRTAFCSFSATEHLHVRHTCLDVDHEQPTVADAVRAEVVDRLDVRVRPGVLTVVEPDVADTGTSGEGHVGGARHLDAHVASTDRDPG